MAQNHERIREDFSITLRVADDDDESVLINRVYDHVHVFRWLNHGILKIITEEGLAQYHVGIDTALRVARMAGITPIERDEISVAEHEAYLRSMANVLCDDWLEGTADGHPEPSVADGDDVVE